MAEDTKSGAVKLMRKLVSRERLFELAAAPGQEKDPELAALKSYLADWAKRSEPLAIVSGLPGAVPYAGMMRGTPSWDVEEDLRVDESIRGEIDLAINEITPVIPLARPCLMVRYMNLAGPAVYRHGRLHQLFRNEIEDVADAAELALVPVVKRRGVFL